MTPKRPQANKSLDVNADAEVLQTQFAFNRHIQNEMEKLRKEFEKVSKERDFYKLKLKNQKGVENIDPNINANGSGTSQTTQVNAEVHVDAENGAAKQKTNNEAAENEGINNEVVGTPSRLPADVIAAIAATLAAVNDTTDSE